MLRLISFKCFTQRLVRLTDVKEKQVRKYVSVSATLCCFSISNGYKEKLPFFSSFQNFVINLITTYFGKLVNSRVGRVGEIGYFISCLRSWLVQVLGIWGGADI